VARVDRRELGAIFVGGAVGALARVGLVAAGLVDAGEWPWPTFVANVAGAFLLGYFGVSSRLSGSTGA
jgi:CrcB protein